MSEPLPQLEMVRPTLDDLLPVEVAPGYSLRSYRPGDEPVWAGLVNVTVGGTYTAEDTAAQIAETPQFAPEDLLFAVRDGAAVGTAWARRTAGQSGEGVGYVHMVGVLPEHQGRRLGRALTAAVLHRFREIGYRAVTLRTDDFRLAAICTYLALGFRPALTHESHRGRWEAIAQTLGREVMA